MKKYFIITSFFISLFLFSSSVNAETYTFTYTDSEFELLDNLSTMQDSLSLYDNGYFNTHDYLIAYRKYIAGTWQGELYYVVFRNNNTHITVTNNRFSSFSAYTLLCFVNDNFTDLVACPRSWTNSDISDRIFPLYSTYNLTFVTDVNTYIFNYKNKNNIILPSEDTYYPTLSQSYDYFHQDDYPLLSSFVSLVLEKLILICEYFTSSYVFLAVFTIFILYFSILLFRRLL